MRLLIITNRYPCDADDPASPFVPHFVAALQRCGVDLDLLTPRYNHRPVCVEPSFIHRFDTGASIPVGSWNLAKPASWLRLLRFLAAGHGLGRRLCAGSRYDHVLALWALPSGEFARRLSVEFKLPYSVWCLGSDIYSWAKRPVVRSRIERVLRGASQVFGDGDDLCQRVQDWLGIKCAFLPSYRPLTGNLPAGPPPSTVAPRFLYLGRLHRAKGVVELLEAFATVHDKLPNASLTFVGDGPESDYLRRDCAKQRLDGVVHFAGPVGRDAITRAYCECDVVVIPTKSDSIPLVFSEAVQCCRPVIGTDVGDLGTSIRRHGVGLVCEDPTAQLLAQTMLQMADNPIFDMAGRHALLKALDPACAAESFCRNALGMGAGTPSETASSRRPTDPLAVSR